MSTLVTSAAALAAITERARQNGVAAIDTEFVWTRTYYPILGVVQIALNENEVYLVDALAVEDRASLAPLLSSPDIVKVLHDAGSDLVILNRFCGAVPRRVFDARLAAGFCGLTATLSLSRLLHAVLGIELPKTESRSDWTVRPLTPAQVEYARDDVRHMPELYRCLLARLCEHGTADWAWEEMATYEGAETYCPGDPRESYRAISGMGRLRPEQLALLRELAAWREDEARRADRPRGRILNDEHLLDLALRPPASSAELNQGWRHRVREFRRHADAILEAVRRAHALPADSWPRAPGCPLPAKVLKERCDAVLAVVRRVAEARGIDPVLVAPRRLASSFVLACGRSQAGEHPLQRGWRAQLLDSALVPLVAQWQTEGLTQPELPSAASAS